MADDEIDVYFVVVHEQYIVLYSTIQYTVLYTVHEQYIVQVL